MEYQIFDLDGIVIPSSGDMIFTAIKQAVLRIKEGYKDSTRLSITTKFIRRKVRLKDEVGYKMVIGVLLNNRIQIFIEMNRVISSLIYDSIILKVTRKIGEVEYNFIGFNGVPEEIKEFLGLISKEMAIVISLPV